MIRVGLVGCGNIGNVHSNILKDMKQVQIAVSYTHLTLPTNSLV